MAVVVRGGGVGGAGGGQLAQVRTLRCELVLVRTARQTAHRAQAQAQAHETTYGTGTQFSRAAAAAATSFSNLNNVSYLRWCA